MTSTSRGTGEHRSVATGDTTSRKAVVYDVGHM